MPVHLRHARRSPFIFGWKARCGVDDVQMDEHVDEEEDEEGEGVEDQDVGDVRDARVGHELRLLFGGSDEEESRCVQKEWRNVLEAVGFAIFREGVFILENNGDFDNSAKTSSHQSVAEHRVKHRAKWKVLWMRRHSPSRKDDYEGGDEISLWSAI